MCRHLSSAVSFPIDAGSASSRAKLDRRQMQGLQMLLQPFTSPPTRRRSPRPRIFRPLYLQLRHSESRRMPASPSPPHRPTRRLGWLQLIKILTPSIPAAETLTTPSMPAAQKFTPVCRIFPAPPASTNAPPLIRAADRNNQRHGCSTCSAAVTP